MSKIQNIISSSQFHRPVFPRPSKALKSIFGIDDSVHNLTAFDLRYKIYHSTIKRGKKSMYCMCVLSRMENLLVGILKASGWIRSMSSVLSQIIRAMLVFRISSSCASVNLIRGLPPSYQNRSHFLRFLNWMPMIHANVGPTSPPCKGVSESAPVIEIKLIFLDM